MYYFVVLFLPLDAGCVDCHPQYHFIIAVSGVSFFTVVWEAGLAY
jgi:hypothetical protein